MPTASFLFLLASTQTTSYRFSCNLTADAGHQIKYPFPPYMSQRTIFTTNYSVLVRAGWRIMARDMVSELRVIPALSGPATTATGRTLTGVALPEGEYEIFVLTSRMYWRDAMDRKIYTISVHSDQPEISPLPKINHLRVSKFADITGNDVNLQEGETFILQFRFPTLMTLETNQMGFILHFGIIPL
ncbi:MAG: hypothetical protein LBJ67_02660 [Planctomycetaceae bacterium]|nr:hypothetical protein [Planctomycetaceae bacterium]